ncbi:MAG: tetratricopeptide repeat protein [Chloroflexota bacterium]
MGETAVPGKGISWFYCATEEILRQSLNPFKYFLRRYFHLSAESTPAQNRARFHTIFNILLRRLQQESTLHSTTEIQQELRRTQSVIAAMADLYWEDSLYEQLEPQLRFENMLTAFKTLIKAESLLQPVILEIDDGQWLDADSQTMLQRLTRNIAQYPIAILCAARYQDDGRPVQLQTAPDTPHFHVDLNYLSVDGSRTFAAQILGKNMTPELGHFLFEKSNGNPFFVEQLTLDLQERGLLTLHSNGRQLFHLPKAHLEAIPSTINAVLMARLDRLASGVKQVVQTAAVLGREFEVQVLLQMLQNDPDLSQKIHSAAQAQIWSAINEIRYLFKHALLRDSAYTMQLRARRHELHQLAAQAIEQVYAHDLEPHFADLAYHYGQANHVANERFYARRAGEQALAQFANTEAIAHLSRALELTAETDYETRYDLLLLRERVYHMVGQRPLQQQDLDTLQQIAHELTAKQRIEVALRQSQYAEVTGAYQTAVQTAETAVSLAQNNRDNASEARGYLAWGRAAFRLADYTTAALQLEEAYALAQEAHLPDVEASSLLNLGNVAWSQGDYANAHAFYQRALKIQQKAGNAQHTSTILNNLGTVALFQNDYATAQNYFEQALQLKQQIGERRNEGFVLGNLGLVAAHQGHYAAAESYQQQSLQIRHETGDRYGESLALLNLGTVALYQGEYGRAQTCYQQAGDFFREVNDRHGETGVLLYVGLLAHLTDDNKAAFAYNQQALEIAKTLGARHEQSLALLNLGHVYQAYGAAEMSHTWWQANQAYQQAREILQTLGHEHLTMEIIAGLARTSGTG